MRGAFRRNFRLVHNYTSTLLFFTLSTNTFAGLKLGTLCAGMMTDLFWEMIRPTFCLRCLITKLPKLRMYTFSPSLNAFFTTVKNPSKEAETSALSIPVFWEISMITSAFVTVAKLLGIKTLQLILQQDSEQQI